MKNLGDLNNWTKNDLARVVCQALFNADKPLDADHFQVKRMMKQRKEDLVTKAARAIEILSNRSYRNLDASQAVCDADFMNALDAYNEAQWLRKNKCKTI